MSKIITLAIIEVGIIVLMLVTGEASIGIICVVLPVLFFAGVIMNRIASAKISAKIKIVDDNSKGENIKIVINVKNGSAVPAFRNSAKLLVENKNFKLSDSTEFLFSLSGHQERELVFFVKSIYCGVYDITISNIRCRDIWGITYREVTKNEKFTSYMYPPFEMISKVEEVLRASYEKERKFAGRKNTIMTDILQYRDYEKGDSLKNVNWKLSSKMGKLILREFDTPVDNQILLALDIGNGDIDYENICYSIFFSIAITFVKSGISFQAGWNANGKFDVVNIENSDQLFSCFRNIFVTSFSNGEPVANIFEKQGNPRKYAKIIYVTNQNSADINNRVKSWGNAESIIVDKSNFSLEGFKDEIRRIRIS